MRRPATAAIVAVLLLAGIVSASAATINVTADITTSQTWTSDNTYILTVPVYVKNGATLTIQPGTVIRGEPESSPGAFDPGTLIITRDSKLYAVGTALKPIVFTDLNDNNIGGNPGTAPYNNAVNALGLTGRWGGLILLGRAYVANNTAAGPNASREVQIEGLTATGSLGFYGNCTADAVAPLCDDDDSGVVRYVSLRYGGFNLSANNEINGISLGGVGRNTDVDYLDVFQNKDDFVEIFGGTVNVKHVIGANGGDDGLDTDEGWRGKAQFVFMFQGTPGNDKNDKGGEWDGGNNPDASQPRAIPTLYNLTFIGLGQKTYTGKALNTVIHMRDNAGGRLYNSYFGDFGGAPGCIEGTSGSPTGADSSGQRAITSYVQDGVFYLPPASTFELEMQNNTWWCMGNGGTWPTGDGAPYGCDTGKLHFDPGIFTNGPLNNQYLSCATANPIKALTRLAIPDPTLPDIIGTVDPRPAIGSPLLTTNRVPPNDGFFDPAPYRGAFAGGGCDNWAEGWSTPSRLGYFPPRPQVLVTSDITTSQTWTAQNEYILTVPVYVKNGATLTIEPCTVIRGEPESTPGAFDPGTLIITRDAKLIAVGTEDKPIVFTDLQDSNVRNDGGRTPYDTGVNALGLTGRWGGLVMLGRAYVANNTSAGPNPAREVQIEGLTATGSLGFYGNCAADAVSPLCDDDDSGIVDHISLRYGGFNLSANNEINGVSLGGVGRNTDIDYIDVIQNKDDSMEIFGGTVNVKHVIGGLGGDDGLDTDEGWRGKAQFVFIYQGTPGADKSDKGGEWDGGNNPDQSQPKAIPTLYNLSMIGLGQKTYTGKALNTGFHMRDNAGGRVYNSYWGDFGGAPGCIEGTSGSSTGANSSGERSITAYVQDGIFYLPPASAFELELQDNTWWCMGNGGTWPTGDGAPYGCDTAKLHHDPGVFTNAALHNGYVACAGANPMRSLTRLAIPDPTLPDVIGTMDPRPAAGSPLRTTVRTPPSDGFFTEAHYRGAFSPSDNWAAPWTTPARLGYFASCNTTTNPAAVPDEVRMALVKFKTGTQIKWDPNTWNTTLYDVIRSTNPADFVGGTATCLESNDGDFQAIDNTNPAAGQAFFYLIRGKNDCGAGSLGFRTSGVERTGRNCP